MYRFKTNPMKDRDEDGNMQSVGGFLGVPIPQKGKDYFTEDDKEELIAEIITRIPDGSEDYY